MPLFRLTSTRFLDALHSHRLPSALARHDGSKCMICLSPSPPSTALVFRRLLRLTSWMDENSAFKIFLSGVCQRRDERSSPLYVQALETYFHTSRYAIPHSKTASLSSLKNLKNDSCKRTFSNHIVKVFRSALFQIDFATETTASAHGTKDSRDVLWKGIQTVGTKRKSNVGNSNTASSDTLSLSQLLDGAFCGIRHLRRIQRLAASIRIDIPERSGAYYASNLCTTDLFYKCRLVPKDEFRAITEGMLLVAHPLAEDIWRETVILITHVSKSASGRIEGVILNRKPSECSASQSVHPVPAAFSECLFNLTSKKFRHLSPRTIEDLMTAMRYYDQTHNTQGQRFNPVQESSKEFLASQRSLLRSVLQEIGFFGGPVSEITILRNGAAAANSKRIIVPEVVSVGKPSEYSDAKKTVTELNRKQHRVGRRSQRKTSRDDGSRGSRTRILHSTRNKSGSTSGSTSGSRSESACLISLDDIHRDNPESNHAYVPLDPAATAPERYLVSSVASSTCPTSDASDHTEESAFVLEGAGDGAAAVQNGIRRDNSGEWVRRSQRETRDTNRANPNAALQATQDSLRYFVGRCVWDKEQLHKELKDGHWLPVQIGCKSVLQHVVWDPDIGSGVWRNLLHAVSEDLYEASFLPHHVIDTSLSERVGSSRRIDRFLYNMTPRLELLLKTNSNGAHDEEEDDEEEDEEDEDEEEEDEEDVTWIDLEHENDDADSSADEE